MVATNKVAQIKEPMLKIIVKIYRFHSIYTCEISLVLVKIS